MNKIIYIAIFIITFCLGAIVAWRNNDTSYENYQGHQGYQRYEWSGGDDMYRNRRITATQAKELMGRYSAIILDVRSASEFAQGHIPGAILLPDYDIKDRADYVLTDTYALILVYCRSGNRSRAATSLLLSMGYENVYDFGGINAWPYEVVR